MVLNALCKQNDNRYLYPAGRQGLAPYGGEIPGDDDARFAEEQGPLCIGLAPPEDAYLPIEPEPDVSEDAEDERDTEENARDAVWTDIKIFRKKTRKPPLTPHHFRMQNRDVADIGKQMHGAG